jgi:hypothetical protein
MRKLIISTIVLVPMLAGAALAATDADPAIRDLSPGGSNGVCEPDDIDWNPCGTGFTVSVAVPEQQHHHGHNHGHNGGAGRGHTRR